MSEYLATRRAKAREYKTFRQAMTRVFERYVLLSSIVVALHLLRAAS